MSRLNRHGYSDQAWEDDRAARIQRDLDRPAARSSVRQVAYLDFKPNPHPQELFIVRATGLSVQAQRLLTDDEWTAKCSHAALRYALGVQ